MAKPGGGALVKNCGASLSGRDALGWPWADASAARKLAAANVRIMLRIVETIGDRFVFMFNRQGLAGARTSAKSSL